MSCEREGEREVIIVLISRSHTHTHTHTHTRTQRQRGESCEREEKEEKGRQLSELWGQISTNDLSVFKSYAIHYKQRVCILLLPLYAITKMDVFQMPVS